MCYQDPPYIPIIDQAVYVQGVSCKNLTILCLEGMRPDTMYYMTFLSF